MKSIIFIKGSRRAIKRFPKQARKDAGAELFSLQLGAMPNDWKPMPIIGLGASEIRLHEPHEHRVIYVVRFSEAIYVLHAFEKKSPKTSKRDIEAARSSYAKMQEERKLYKERKESAKS